MRTRTISFRKVAALLTIVLMMPGWTQVWGQTCNYIMNPSFEDGATANNWNMMNNASNWYNGCPNPCNGYTCGVNTGNTPDLMDVNTSSPNANGTTVYTGHTLPIRATDGRILQVLRVSMVSCPLLHSAA